MKKNLVFIHKARLRRGQPLHDQKTDQGHSLTSRLLKFMKVNTGQTEWRLAEKLIKCLKVSVRWEADGKDDIGEVVLAGFYQKPADMDLKASRRNLMFTSGHPVCRFHTDHRRSKTLKSSWRRMCCRSGPWHRPCKHYLLVSEGMLQYVGSHFEWKLENSMTGMISVMLVLYLTTSWLMLHTCPRLSWFPQLAFMVLWLIWRNFSHYLCSCILKDEPNTAETEGGNVCSLAWFQEGSETVLAETGRALSTCSSFWRLSNITYLVTKRYYLLCLQNTRKRNWRRDITSRK